MNRTTIFFQWIKRPETQYNRPNPKRIRNQQPKRSAPCPIRSLSANPLSLPHPPIISRIMPQSIFPSLRASGIQCLQKSNDQKLETNSPTFRPQSSQKNTSPPPAIPTATSHSLNTAPKKQLFSVTTKQDFSPLTF